MVLPLLYAGPGAALAMLLANNSTGSAGRWIAGPHAGIWSGARESGRLHGINGPQQRHPPNRTGLAHSYGEPSADGPQLQLPNGRRIELPCGALGDGNVLSCGLFRI